MGKNSSNSVSKNKDFLRSKTMRDIVEILNQSNSLQNYIEQCIKCCDYLLEKLDDIYKNTLLGPLYNGRKFNDLIIKHLENRATRKIYKMLYKDFSQLKSDKNFDYNMGICIRSLYDDVVIIAEEVYECIENRPESKGHEVACVAMKKSFTNILEDYKNKKFCECDIEFKNFNIGYQNNENEIADNGMEK